MPDTHTLAHLPVALSIFSPPIPNRAGRTPPEFLSDAAQELAGTLASGAYASLTEDERFHLRALATELQQLADDLAADQNRTRPRTAREIEGRMGQAA